MHHEHVGSGHVVGVQQVPQFGGDVGRGARQLGRVAPPCAGPVVQDGGGVLGDTVVDVEVVESESAAAGQEHYGGPSAPRAVQQ